MTWGGGYTANWRKRNKITFKYQTWVRVEIVLIVQP